MTYRVWVAMFMVCLAGLLRPGTTLEEMAALPEMEATYRAGTRPEVAAKETLAALREIARNQ